jgi:ferrous iron transport protein A
MPDGGEDIREVLSMARRGARGAVTGLMAGAGHGVSSDELERRLLEIGFVEGARFEVLHVGLIGGDPIAVRLDDTRIALRRREARAIRVRLDP